MRGLVRTTGTVALWLAVVTGGHAQSQNGEAEGRRNDLAAFRRNFLSIDSSYTPQRRAEAERRLARLEADAGKVSAAYFELELARIVALADNGHTSSPASLRSRRYARVPLRFVPFGDQFHVLRADSAHADLLGARLLAIDGRTLRELRAVAHTLWGGPPAWRDRSVPFLLESPDQMQALGLTRDGSAATYRLMLRGGNTVERRITADPPNANRDSWNSSRWLMPEALPSDPAGWRSLGDPGRAPWAFRDPSVTLRRRHDVALDAMVVQLRANHDTPTQRIAPFLDSTMRDIRRASPRHLILDLRTNGGGDLNNTRDFVQFLPALVPGRIFVLTSPWTFSAAISTTGYLKQAGGDRVTIVGEMVGDRLEFWAEGRVTRLPFSGAAMAYSTQRHDYQTGCRPYRDCHGAVVRFPISVPTLAPVIEAPLTVEAVVGGRDPGMEAVVRALRGRQGSDP